MDYKDFSSQFTSYLKNGEKIYWTGKPIGGWRFNEIDIILIPITIILCGFTGLLDFILIKYGSVWLFNGLGILLSLLCFYMVFLRFFNDKRRRENTFYCLTNRRLIVSQINRRKPKVTILAISDIKYAVLNEDKNGYGHIVFNNNNPVFSWLFGSFLFASTEVPGLEMIENVNSVFELLSRLQNEAQ